MKNMVIRVRGINDACRLAAAAQKVDGDVTIKRGRIAVDGKSMMGVLALDMSDGVTIIYPNTAEDFEKFLAEFVKG